MPELPDELLSRDDIAELVERSRSLPNTAFARHQFAQEVETMFGPLLEARLSIADRAVGSLKPALHSELTNVVLTLLPGDAYFVDHYSDVLDQLIKACRWKQLPVHTPLTRIVDGEPGVPFQQAIQRQIIRYRNQEKSTRLRRLTRLLTETDQPVVAYRTLRAFAAHLNNKAPRNRHEIPLFRLRHGQIRLYPSHLRPFLEEQTEFLVYLFHSQTEAGFLAEAAVRVEGYIRRQLTDRIGIIKPKLAENIKDTVRGIEETFIRKCQALRADPVTFYTDPNAFFLDARLYTYLTGFVKKGNMVNELIKGRQDKIRFDRLPDQFDAAGDIADNEVDDDQLQQQIRLNRCLALLDDFCRILVTLRYGFGSSDGKMVSVPDLAEQYDMPFPQMDTKLRTCMRRLTTCMNRPPQPKNPFR